jgi:type II secretory pathway pseudopilin PulG
MTKLELQTHRRRLRQQRGYFLLTLLLFMALLAIAAAAVAPTIARQIQRDREEELIHRGMQYRRAIRRFIKQTGRYPMKLEDLDTGSVRYLRKRYKDPITGLDFKPLHMLDIPRVGAPIPNPSSSQQGGTENGSPDNSNVTPDAARGPDQTLTPAEPPVRPPEQSGAQVQNARPAQPAASAPQQPANLGGGVIIGVASTSGKKTIREFNRKSRYDQWLFFYDPSFDRTQEIYGPTPVGGVPAALQNPPGGPNPHGQPASQQ